MKERRSDWGQVRATERDLYILRWVGEQFAIRLDHLKSLVEWYGGEAISESNVKRLVTRWQQAGWVEKQKLLAGKPQWLWLSKAGLETFGLDLPYWTPSIARLNHLYHVNAVRLWVDARSERQAVWKSERVVNQQRKDKGKKHLVDGEVLYQGVNIAVEVELTQKSRQRLDSILQELQADYDNVWYFCTSDCYTAVEEAVGRKTHYKDVFALYDVDKIVRDV